MRKSLLLASLILSLFPWRAFAGPMPFLFMVNDNYCMAEFASSTDSDIGLAVSDPWPFSEKLDGVYTCFGQDARVRPSAPMENISLQPDYGACELPTSSGYPKMNYFYWKAKVLPDGRFQVFCGVDPLLVESAAYSAVVDGTADQVERRFGKTLRRGRGRVNLWL